MPWHLTRRTFLQTAILAAVPLRWPRHRRDPVGSTVTGHPAPRPGISAAKVVPASQLDASPEITAIFDQIREIPAVADGIRCQCDCSALEDYYSLLTCYEGLDAMARHCEICQAQGRLVSRLHRSGRTLDQIRKAIDARFS